MRGLALALITVAACGGGPDPLAITEAIPPYGPLIGGTLIALTGTGFSTDGTTPVRVFVGGREASLVVAVDDAAIGLVIPPGERPGDAEILVLDGSANARATGVFRYSTPPEITSVAPGDVVSSSASTVMIASGHGFLNEGAGEVSVVVGSQLATGVQVASDTSLTFVAPPGIALSRPDVQVIDQRGAATLPRAFRYTPSTRPGLLLFPQFAGFAVFFDPVDNSSVQIPWVNGQTMRLTSVVVDADGEYWGADRSLLFGRIDTNTQRLDAPVATAGLFPTVARVGNQYLGLDRLSLRFGALDPVTGGFTPIGTVAIPCCGSYGLAYDGTTLYFTSREGGVPTINTIDPVTGEIGTPVTITGPPGFHVEEMRFFAGQLYATSVDALNFNGTLVVLDPVTGATTPLPVSLGRFSAMEVFQ